MKVVVIGICNEINFAKVWITPTYANFDRICDIAYSICKKLALPKVAIL
jgi:hypothetical protein